MSEHDEILQALRRLKLRLSSGEIDESTYDRLRERILADLTPSEQETLGVSGTPQPVTPSLVSPLPGTPTPVGPSGGPQGGLRTAKTTRANLELQPGSILLGQWRLIRELGRGGFGVVFEAEEMSLNTVHAVKILDSAMVAKEDLLERFRREVSLMRRLVHPRIVRVYDYREDLSQNLALLSMELVPYGSVRQLLAEAKSRRERVPLSLALSILNQSLEALAEAHSDGVIHRDVTPGNVLLAGGSADQLLAEPNRDPRVKLMDFGIAGLVERSEISARSRVLGTAAYVAPEILDPSVEVTPAADVYGAAAMGYELVTGQLPAGRFDEPITLRPDLRPEFNRFILGLLAVRPEERPTAKAAAWALSEFLEQAAEDDRRQQAVRTRMQEEARELRERLPESAQVHSALAESTSIATDGFARSALRPAGLLLGIVAAVAIGWIIMSRPAHESNPPEPKNPVVAASTPPEPSEVQRASSTHEEAVSPPSQDETEGSQERQAEEEKNKAIADALQQERERIRGEERRRAETAMAEKVRMAKEEERRRSAIREEEKRVEQRVLADGSPVPSGGNKARQAESAPEPSDAGAAQAATESGETAKEPAGVESRPIAKKAQVVDEEAERRRRNEAAQAQLARDGLWLDFGTGLLWMARDNGREVEWSLANVACLQSNFAGFSDWRLPSVSELQRLAEVESRLEVAGQLRVERTGCCLWSHETVNISGSTHNAAFVNFEKGKRLWTNKLMPRARTLCVRRIR